MCTSLVPKLPSFPPSLLLSTLFPLLPLVAPFPISFYNLLLLILLLILQLKRQLYHRHDALLPRPERTHAGILPRRANIDRAQRGPALRAHHRRVCDHTPGSGALRFFFFFFCGIFCLIGMDGLFCRDVREWIEGGGLGMRSDTVKRFALVWFWKDESWFDRDTGEGRSRLRLHYLLHTTHCSYLMPFLSCIKLYPYHLREQQLLSLRIIPVVHRCTLPAVSPECPFILHRS